MESNPWSDAYDSNSQSDNDSLNYPFDEKEEEAEYVIDDSSEIDGYEESEQEENNTLRYSEYEKQTYDEKVQAKNRPTKNNFDLNSVSSNDTKSKQFKKIKTFSSCIEVEDEVRREKNITTGVCRRKINISKKEQDAYLKRFNNANKKFDDLPSFEKLYTVKGLFEKLGWKELI